MAAWGSGSPTSNAGAGLYMPSWRPLQWGEPEQPAPPPPSPAPTPAPAYQAPPALTMPSAPAPAPQPAMQGLESVANGEKLGQEINPEGWDVEQPPDFDVPGARQMPPSSRALSQLAQQQGRVY